MGASPGRPARMTLPEGSPKPAAVASPGLGAESDAQTSSIRPEGCLVPRFRPRGVVSHLSTVAVGPPLPTPVGCEQPQNLL